MAVNPYLPLHRLHCWPSRVSDIHTISVTHYNDDSVSIWRNGRWFHLTSAQAKKRIPLLIEAARNHPRMQREVTTLEATRFIHIPKRSHHA